MESTRPKELEESNYKATILWHEIWFEGPIVGVCDYNGEKMIFSRNSENKYEIRRFVEGGYEKALKHHISYRESYGGIRDHDPQYYSMTKRNNVNQMVAITKTFDYYNHGISDIVDILNSKDFKNFYPPRQVKMNFNKEREAFVPSEGKDIPYKGK